MLTSEVHMQTDQRLRSSVRMTVPLNAELAQEIEIYRQSITPVVPSTTKVIQLLVAKGLTAAREDLAAHRQSVRRDQR